MAIETRLDNDLNPTREKTDKGRLVDGIVALLVVVIPTIAAVAAIPMAAARLISWTDLLISLGMYMVSASGLGVGFHRLLAHRSFKCGKVVRALLCVAGSLALQGPAIRWVADHRRHHAFSDRPGDTHSPQSPAGSGLWEIARSLLWAHLGWLFDVNKTTVRKFAPDLLSDRLIVRLDGMYPAWVLATLALPGLAGLALTQSLAGALTAVYWGGLVRIFVLHQLTWSVNSIGHRFFGTQPFKTNDQSRNIWLMGLLILGEGWHNNHHAFPESAFHGLRRSQIDINGIVIWLLERAGLAWDVKRVSAEVQASKRLPGEGSANVSGALPGRDYERRAQSYREL
jgi:stearoyl-CoA desaturase (delta-9 desaturase)